MRRNVFQAKPVKFRGRKMLGVVTHPGFHAAGSAEITFPYAHAKVEWELPSEAASVKPDWDYPLSDYPVIVEIDTQGLSPLPDYDAEEAWRASILNFLAVFEEDYEGWQPVRSLEKYTDRYWEPPNQESASRVVDALFILSQQDPDVFGALRFLEYLQSYPEDEGDRRLRKIMRTGELSTTALMAICDQYRYLEDVSQSRIMSVFYMTPYFDRLFDWHEEELLENREPWITKAGYDIITTDDLYNNVNPTKLKTVFERPKSGRGQGVLFEAGEVIPRYQFHGTSYENLLLAAPELEARLPVPPTPYVKRKE